MQVKAHRIIDNTTNSHLSATSSRLITSWCKYWRRRGGRWLPMTTVGETRSTTPMWWYTSALCISSLCTSLLRWSKVSSGRSTSQSIRYLEKKNARRWRNKWRSRRMRKERRRSSLSMRWSNKSRPSILTPSWSENFMRTILIRKFSKDWKKIRKGKNCLKG